MTLSPPASLRADSLPATDPDPSDDAALVRSARNGAEEAFAALVHRHAPRLHRFLVRRGCTTHDAEDLVQETFLQAYTGLERYDPRYAFVPWLFTIARRRMIDQVRRRRRHLSLEAVPEPTAPEPAAAKQRGEGVWTRARALLPPRQYEALWLHYGESMPVRDVARVLGIAQIHARVLLHRGRTRLAAILDPGAP